MFFVFTEHWLPLSFWKIQTKETKFFSIIEFRRLLLLFFPIELEVNSLSYRLSHCVPTTVTHTHHLRALMVWKPTSRQYVYTRKIISSGWKVDLTTLMFLCVKKIYWMCNRDSVILDNSWFWIWQSIIWTKSSHRNFFNFSPCVTFYNNVIF